MTEKNPLIDFLYKKLNPEAIKSEKPFKEQRKDNMRFYKGDQWRRKQAGYKAKSVTNYVSLIVRDECAIITDGTPQINVRPVDGGADIDTAYILKKLLDHVSYKNRMRRKIYEAVKLTSIEQICYFRPYWDSTASNGQGDVKIAIERAESIKRDASGENNFFKIEKKVTLAEINRLFPDKIDEVKAQVMKEVNSSYADTTKKPNLPVQSTDGSTTIQYDNTSLTTSEQFETVDFDTWWLKDDSVEKLQDPKDPNQFEMKAKYPNGRWVYVANEKIILKDEPCQIKHFPIVPLILDPDPESSISGISNIDYVRGQQIDANEMKAMIKDWLRAVAYPRGRANPQSIADPKKIRNYPGTIVPSAPGDFSWDSAPPVPNDLFNFQRMSKDDIEYVSSITDVTQGRRPGGVTSAEGMQLLLESSRTVMRPKTMLLEMALMDVYDLCIDYIQVGYNVPRMVRIMGEELSLNSIEIQKGMETIKNNVQVGEYDVEIEPDSTMPRSDIERFNRLKELASLGFVDRRALLQASGLPAWQEIDARMQKKEDEWKAEQAKQSQSQGTKPPSTSINLRDLPPTGQQQLAEQVGIQLDPKEVIANQMFQKEKMPEKDTKKAP